MSLVQTLGQYLASLTSIIDTSSPLYSRIPQFLQDETNSQLLKNTMLGMFHSYPLQRAYESNNEIIPQIIMNYLVTNNYRYTTLYDTMFLDYNPIENYRMEEVGEDNTSNIINGNDKYGEYSETSTQAATTDSTEHGAHTDTIDQNYTYASHTDTHIESPRNDVDTRKVSPEDSTTFYNAEQHDLNIGQKQLTDEIGQHIDNNNTTNEYTSYTDNVNVGERRTTTSRTPFNNSAEQKTLTSFTHKFQRSGNIGVTTSQQMIEAQRQVAEFNIYKIIATDLMSILCVRTSIPIHTNGRYYVPFQII